VRPLNLLTLLILTLGLSSHAAETRTTLSFDHDWRFLKGDAPGAEQPRFDHAAWRIVNVPHDWSIEGPFSKDNPTSRAGGYLPAGVGWYRKNFTLPEAEAGRRVFIDFDGVMANSDVWINGFKLGHRPYGYVSFRYELTGHLNAANQPNVLVVRADNAAQPASRWYAGAGIYRHVRLVTTNPVHLENWSTFVTTPEVSDNQSTVRVESAVVNQSTTAREVTVEVTLLDPSGKPVQTATTKPQTIAAGATVKFNQALTVETPQRWDLDHPHLYTAITRVRSGAATLDEERTPFGIREFRFEADTGFWLNGRNLKLKGVCLHYDVSALGTAVPLRAWERRLDRLREVGVNAIRPSHHPFSPDFLDLCDRMGFLVMDELFDGWTIPKNKADYHLFFDEWSETDTRDTVRRDRNHPSIILYSTGNEVKDTRNPELAKRILRSLLAVFHENDPTRPVTQAIFRPNVTRDYDNGFADLLDVLGQNYRENELAAAHTQKPARKILGTENGHTVEAWRALRDNPALAGQFLWTGFDYLGESEGWPNIAFTYGLFDRTGTPHARAFQRQSWWSAQPMVHVSRRVSADALQPNDPGFGLDRGPQVLFSDWTPTSHEPHKENVEIYSNCDEVELWLNDQSLGTKRRPADDSPRNWQVAYAPGTLRAVGKNAGQIVATHELKTAGKPARIVLIADRTNISPAWDDLSYIEATVVDAQGVLVPSASDQITFKVEGPGRVVATDSANNASHESFQASERRAYQGRCFALVKADSPNGRITIEASAPGLKKGAITLTATPAISGPVSPSVHSSASD
jgi:beta-galactosidase